jgi:hypothetical protein
MDLGKGHPEEVRREVAIGTETHQATPGVAASKNHRPDGNPHRLLVPRLICFPQKCASAIAW